MTIQNGLGITGYSRRMSRGLEGQPAESFLPLADTYRVPLLGQVNTITVGAFADDTDAIAVDITLPDGTVVEAADIVRAAGVPADADAAAAAIAAAINAEADVNNHVSAEAAANVVTLTFLHPNVEYTVATRVTGTTAAVAQTQAAGGTAATPGRFVAAGTSIGGVPAIAALGNADDETAMRGVVLREHGGVNAGSALASAVDQVQPPALVAVAHTGKVLMRNNGSVAAAKGGLVYVVVNTAGGQERGMARSDDDAGNSVPISLSRAYWADATPAGEIGAVMLKM